MSHQYVGSLAELHVFENLEVVWCNGQQVAAPARRLHPGSSTTPAHMPERHSHHHQWTPGRLKSWAESVGPEVLTWGSACLDERRILNRSTGCAWGWAAKPDAGISG